MTEEEVSKLDVGDVVEYWFLNLPNQVSRVAYLKHKQFEDIGGFKARVQFANGEQRWVNILHLHPTQGAV